MNSTLKSLLFWMVLIVVGVLIWQFSTGLQRNETSMTFSQFMKHVDNGEVAQVTMTGNELTGTLNNSVNGDGSSKFRTLRPAPVRRTRQQAVRQGHPDHRKTRDHQSLGHPALLLGAHPADDRLLAVHHAADAERREQGAVVRQEPREAVVELAEKGDVQGRCGRRRGEGRAPGDHRVPEGAAEVPEARRAHSEGRAPHGPSGNRQDAARARRRGRSERAVLLDQRLGLRRDVRRRRRLARPRPLRAGQEERAVHRLHRRNRRGRPSSRRRPRRRARRARADAQSAARRDGRLRVERGRHSGRGDEPSGRTRSRTASSRPLRSTHRREPARRQGTRGHPRRPYEEDSAVRRREHSRARARLVGLLRRGSRRTW